MDYSSVQENTFNDIKSFKLSPLTSAGTLSELQQNVFTQSSFKIQIQLFKSLPTCKNHAFQAFSIEEQHKLQQNKFFHIQKQIMDYFKRKGVSTGHPQDLKKEYNRKLHKRASLSSQVSESVVQKTAQGSSLLQRRLKKKMTISL